MPENASSEVTSIDDLTDGKNTSEFKLAKLVIFAGIAVDVVGALLEGLKHAGLDFGWLPAAMIVVGTLASLLASLGYTRSRTMVKVAQIAPKVGAEVAHVLPLLKEAQGIVKEARASKEPTLPSGPPPNLP